ncbi:MAG: integrin alpha [Planctomycetes bacterium]|nr:integrin alpha [Planctomycetota bacterium]
MHARRTSRVRKCAGVAAAVAMCLAIAHGASTPVVSIDGSAHGTTFGASTAALGDVNGDGVIDFAVGGPTYDAGQRGRVVVYDGATLLELYHRDGPAADDRFATFLAAVPDANSDGVADLFVGAPSLASPVQHPGRAFLLSGANGAELLRFAGEDNGGIFGVSVAALGDVTSDGIGDYAIGEPGLTEAPGAVRIYSGADGTAVPGTTRRGTGDDRLGREMVAVGDVNRDAIGDFAALAPGADLNGGETAGRLIVFSGANMSEIVRYEGIPLQPLGPMTGGVLWTDVDGDKKPELLAGSLGGFRRFDPTVPKNRVGKQLVYDVDTTGPRPKPVVPIGGPAYNARALPDLDGIPGGEFAFFQDGHVYVVAFNGKLLRLIANVFPTVSTYSFGASFESISDLAGPSGAPRDGVPDLLVGIEARQKAEIHAFGVTRTPPLPAKSVFRAPFLKSGDIAGSARGALSVRAVNGTFKCTATLSRAAPGTYSVEVESGPGSGVFRQLGTIAVTKSTGKLILNAKGAIPPAFGTQEFGVLGGCRVRVRDGMGADVVSALVPFATDPASARGALPFTSAPSSPFPGAQITGSFSAALGSGRQQVDVRVKGVPASEPLSLWMGDDEDGEFVRVGDFVAGRFTADTANSTWSLDGLARALNFLERPVRILRASDIVASTPALRSGVAYPDLIVRSVEFVWLPLEGSNGSFQVYCDIENQGDGDCGQVNLQAELRWFTGDPSDIDNPNQTGAVIAGRMTVAARSLATLPAHTVRRDVLLRSSDGTSVFAPPPAPAGPPNDVHCRVRIDPHAAGDFYGEYPEIRERNNANGHIAIWDAGANTYR